MRKPIVAVILMVLSTAVLAACGGDDRTTSTETATVPGGTLGSQGSVRCATPVMRSVEFTVFNVHNMSCDVATPALEAILVTGRYPDGFACTSSGNRLRGGVQCAGSDDAQFSADWKPTRNAAISG